MKTAAYIRNRCYVDRINKTPFEMFTGKKPDISNMHTFGTTCYAYIQNPKKLEARSEEGVFIGYDTRSPAYLVYLPETDEIKRVRCMKFMDDEPDEENEDYDPPRIKMNKKAEVPPNHSMSSDDGEYHDASGGDEKVNETQQVEGKTEGKSERYPKRDRKKPKHLNDYETNFSDNDNVCSSVDYCYKISVIPSNYDEAMSSPESNQWKKAMDEEIDALKRNQTYDLVPLNQHEQKPIGGRWVYALKIGADGQEKFKARFVAKGYSQIKDFNYQETFSPTARMTSIRMLMQIAVQENMTVHQMDFKTAYLNADLDYDIYMHQPEGCLLYTSDAADE